MVVFQACLLNIHIGLQVIESGVQHVVLQSVIKDTLVIVQNAAPVQGWGRKAMSGLA